MEIISQKLINLSNLMNGDDPVNKAVSVINIAAKVIICTVHYYTVARRTVA